MGAGFEAFSRAMALILIDIYLHHYSCLLHIWTDLLAEIRAFVSRYLMQIGVRLKGTTAIEAIHLRHINIHIDETGSMFPGQQQGSSGRVSGQDRCRRITKELPLQFDEKLGVVNNQEAKRCTHGVKPLCISNQ